MQSENNTLKMKKIWMISLLFAVYGLQLNAKTQSNNKHVVKKGETLYSLAKTYHVSVKDLAKMNSISTKTGIKTGQQIIIPGLKTTKTVARNYKPIPVASTPDTPYREEDIHSRRILASANNTEPVVEEESTTAEKPKEDITSPKPPVAAEGLRTSSSNASEYPSIFNRYASEGYKMKKNRGAANYLGDATSGNQNLAFYNDAETGSVIRVTNLMNHNTIFVKVIGKVPQADASKEIVLKLSNKAARDLEAVDEKFLVEVASFSSN